MHLSVFFFLADGFPGLLTKGGPVVRFRLTLDVRGQHTLQGTSMHRGYKIQFNMIFDQQLNNFPARPDTQFIPNLLGNNDLPLWSNPVSHGQK